MNQSQVDALKRYVRTYECMIFTYWLRDLFDTTLDTREASPKVIPIRYHG